MEVLRQRQFRRIGLACSLGSHVRVQGRWLAGYLLAQTELPQQDRVKALITEDIDDPVIFKDWLQQERPDVIHCHDGHAAILPAMMRENAGWRAYFRRTGAVVTVHNAGLGYHQEVDDLDFARAVTALPDARPTTSGASCIVSRQKAASAARLSEAR